MVVERVFSRAGWKQHAAPKTHLLAVANLLDRDVDVVDVDDCNPGVAARICVAQIGEPAIVGAVALQVLSRIYRGAVLQESGAERRHLRKDHLCGDAVFLELCKPKRGVPLASLGRERIVLVFEHGAQGVVVEFFWSVQEGAHALGPVAGLFCKFLDRFLIEEGAGARHHLFHVRQPPRIAGLMELRSHVLLVGRRKRAGVTIGADDQYIGHDYSTGVPIPGPARSRSLDY